MNDESAQFESLLSAHQGMVYSAAYCLLGNATDAEDITQEVFLRLWSHYPERVRRATVGGWLRAVTRNLCVNHLNRYRFRWRPFTDVISETDHAEGRTMEIAAPETLESALHAKDQRKLIEKALAGLPSGQRAAMRLYHFEELDYAEVARRLRVSVGKVKIDIFRARETMRKRLHYVDGARVQKWN